MKSGFIAILGSPNVGKSSLLNALVGEKISIVSPKPQTTRDRIMGIITSDEYQMIFVDTPGVHKPRNKLGEYMEKCIKGASEGCDAIVIVLDISKPILDKDLAFIKKHLSIAPVYVALNKVDLVSYETVYPILEKLSPLLDAGKEQYVKEIIPISCKTFKNIDVLKNYLLTELKDDILYFDPEDVSDKPLSFMVAEVIREKALWLLQDEIPHGIGIMIQKFENNENVAIIEADIICEKGSHKEIIIGKGGEKIKEIGIKARQDIEKMLDKKVYLDLFVKVRKDWRKRVNYLNDLGYN